MSFSYIKNPKRKTSHFCIDLTRQQQQYWVVVFSEINDAVTSKWTPLAYKFYSVSTAAAVWIQKKRTPIQKLNSCRWQLRLLRTNVNYTLHVKVHILTRQLICYQTNGKVITQQWYRVNRGDVLSSLPEATQAVNKLKGIPAQWCGPLLKQPIWVSK